MRPWQLLAVPANPHVYQKRSAFSPTVPLMWRKQSLEHLLAHLNKILYLNTIVPVLPELLLSNCPVEREADQQGPSVVCTLLAEPGARSLTSHTNKDLLPKKSRQAEIKHWSQVQHFENHNELVLYIFFKGVLPPV